jgi:hypothetical protein
VYTAGFSTVDNYATYKAYYWINQTRYELPTGDSASGDVLAIAVSGTNVYTAGYYLGGGNWKACYWKNQTRHELPTQGATGSASAIAVSGTDVYIAGRDESRAIACFWKNESRTEFEEDSVAIGIAVSGADVYTAGSYGTSGNVCYWKNTTKTDLPAPPASTFKRVLAIAVSGADVYTFGYYNIYPPAVTAITTTYCYWKNTARTDLITRETGDGGAYEVHHMAISGADVYAAGYYDSLIGNNYMTSSKASYWKNGTRTELPSGTGTGSQAYAIAVTVTK